MKILVVEEKEEARFQLYEMLSDEGHQVSMATNGHEVIVLTETQGLIFDLIFLSIHLPIFDSLVIAKKVISEGRYKKSQLIVTTSDILNIIGDDDYAEYFSGYLLKPINKENLMKLINSYEV